MNRSRRQCLAMLGAAACGATLPFPGLRAQPALRMLVGFAPGGAADLVARALADGMRNAGQTVIVENKAGAGGRIATDALLSDRVDANTLLFTPSTNLTLFPHLYRDVRYTPADFEPLGTACTFDFALAVGADSPARTLQQYLELARSDPRQAAYGTPGAGTVMHFLGMMLARESGVALNHIPYKGGAPALTDTMGGIVPALITTLPYLVPMHAAGKIRILATTGRERLPALPDVPTFAQAGHGAAGLTLSEYFALFARPGVDTAAAASLSRAVASSVEAPGYVQAMERQYFHPISTPPAELAGQLGSEYAFWRDTVARSGYRAEG